MEGVFDFVSSLPDPDFQTFQSHISGPDAFDTDKERCERVAADLRVQPSTVGVVVSALAFLYSQVQRAGQDSPKELVNEVVRGVTDEDPSEHAVLVDRLVALLRRNENADTFRKLQRLRTGFLENATGFSSFLDLRPNFNDDRSQIVGLVPIVQFRVSTDADDPAKQALIFQLDERGLKRLKEAVESAERKLDTLLAHSTISPMVTRR
jgi:hypothetical protein